MTDDTFSLKGKNCLVTGASSGLGAHFCQVLMTHGANVVGISRSQCEWEAKSFSQQFLHMIGDITKPESVDELFDVVSKRFDRLDVVVSNAGMSQTQKALKFKSTEMSAVLDINLRAAGEIAARSADLMKSSGEGGSIINISSAMAQTTMVGLSSYAASKAALEQLTKGMAAEWARYGIRVNNLAPGWFPTPMTQERLDQGLGGVLKTRIPQGRLGQLNDLDGALILLASDASKYMTGSTITVDGGFSLIN